MDSGILRIMDAAANRAREGLRVLEDAARFALDDQGLTEELKQLRHDLAGALAMLPMERALLARDTPGDVGTAVKAKDEFERGSAGDVLAANAKRLSEALRSLEECAKTLNPGAAAALEKLRYRGYEVEKRLMGRVAECSAVERFRRVQLYVLLSEFLCEAPRTWEGILEAVLRAASQSGGGERLCVQLREKELADGELLRRARIVAGKCREAGAICIVNDRPDIAQLAEADGVHLGQTDLPCAEARKIMGPRAIIGVSTERLEQARDAIRQGATYIAAGPMFPTTTKEKPRIAGPAYAAEVTAEVKLPVVAIGGVTLENLPELLRAGVRRVAVSSAILRADDPGEKVRSFLRMLQEGSL